eukprot:Sspe_Gene.116384::Locus_105584_Transcript_1_1_Confidence_1.000_Length_1107::g.116384::m.116384
MLRPLLLLVLLAGAAWGETCAQCETELQQLEATCQQCCSQGLLCPACPTCAQAVDKKNAMCKKICGGGGGAKCSMAGFKFPAVGSAYILVNGNRDQLSAGSTLVSGDRAFVQCLNGYSPKTTPLPSVLCTNGHMAAGGIDYSKVTCVGNPCSMRSFVFPSQGSPYVLHNRAGQQLSATSMVASGDVAQVVCIPGYSSRAPLPATTCSLGTMPLLHYSAVNCTKVAWK